MAEGVQLGAGQRAGGDDRRGGASVGPDGAAGVSVVATSAIARLRVRKAKGFRALFKKVEEGLGECASRRGSFR